jgi:hypothetical protein
MVAGPYVKLDSKEQTERLAYRWFIHCWHECLINGFKDTPYNVAVFWQSGDTVSPRKLRSGKEVRWASQIARLYTMHNEIQIDQ